MARNDDLCYSFLYMDASLVTPERVASPAERPAIEAPKRSAVEAATETPEAAAAFVQKVSGDAVVLVRDYTERVAPELKERAEAIAQQITGLAQHADEEIAAVTGETLQQKSPAIVAAELMQRKPIGERKMLAEDRDALEAAEADLTKIHEEGKKPSPAVRAAELMQRKPIGERKMLAEDRDALEAAEANPTKIHAEATARVKVMPTISIGEVPSKVARRITSEDLAAVTARKMISIAEKMGAEEGPELTVKEMTADEVIEAEKSIAHAEASSVAEGTRVAEASPEAKAAKAKETAEAARVVEESDEQQERLERIEAEFTAMNAEAERLFAAGDHEGLRHLAADMEATIDAEEREVTGWKRENSDLALAPKDQLYGFLVGRTLLDIQMARRDRIEAQIALIQEKQENASPQEIASLESQIANLDSEMKRKIGDLLEMKEKKQDKREAFLDDYYGSGYDGGGYGRGTGEAAPASKTPDLTTPVREALISTAEKAANVVSGVFSRWMDFTATGKHSIVEELTRWSNELGSSAKDKERKSKRQQNDQKKAA